MSIVYGLSAGLAVGAAYCRYCAAAGAARRKTTEEVGRRREGPQLVVLLTILLTAVALALSLLAVTYGHALDVQGQTLAGVVGLTPFGVFVIFGASLVLACTGFFSWRAHSDAREPTATATGMILGTRRAFADLRDVLSPFASDPPRADVLLSMSGTPSVLPFDAGSATDRPRLLCFFSSSALRATTRGAVAGAVIAILFLYVLQRLVADPTVCIADLGCVPVMMWAGVAGAAAGLIFATIGGHIARIAAKRSPENANGDHRCKWIRGEVVTFVGPVGFLRDGSFDRGIWFVQSAETHGRIPPDHPDVGGELDAYLTPDSANE
jgi:hypothetical protein